MTIRVAIHQPNFWPWLGYFAKMAQSNIFVFLDDAQFSKNNIINRVRILGDTAPRWLTLPVAAHLGQPISKVIPVQADWRRRHLSLLRNTYGRTPHFSSVWPDIEAWLGTAPDADLGSINRHFIVKLAERFSLTARMLLASELGFSGDVADDRLVRIVQAVAPGGAYLSGRGGAGYQDPAKFAAAGLHLEYYRFTPPIYNQGRTPFQTGLSVLDALFHIGWEVTGQVIHSQ